MREREREIEREREKGDSIMQGVGKIIELIIQRKGQYTSSLMQINFPVGCVAITLIEAREGAHFYFSPLRVSTGVTCCHRT